MKSEWCGRRDLNPGSQAWRACVLNQTRRRPLCFVEYISMGGLDKISFHSLRGFSSGLNSFFSYGGLGLKLP